MTEFLITQIEWAAAYAQNWGFVIIFVLMAVESSFIPFPSEVIMIPAGFLAIRGELTIGDPITDLILSILFGLAGCLAGAYVNYYLALFVGRPVLYKYGKYFFLSEHNLKRSEEIFNKYGDITTFVCRLIPGIRQIISIPAGLARMTHAKFAFYTSLGAGIWTAILALIGFYLGNLSKNMTYADLVHKGKDILRQNYHWIGISILLIITIYIFLHKKIIASSKTK